MRPSSAFASARSTCTCARAIEDFDAAEQALGHARNAVLAARQDLKDCEGRAPGPSAFADAKGCTDKKWGPLLARSKKLKLPDFEPLVRKILAERRQHKTAQAARDVKRLRSQLKTEVTALKGLAKAVDACKK